MPDDVIKIYFDVTNQSIVLKGILQYHSLTFELIDIQGKIVLKKMIEDSNSINAANIPNGIYFYRLLQNGHTIHSGKLLKY